MLGGLETEASSDLMPPSAMGKTAYEIVSISSRAIKRTGHQQNKPVAGGVKHCRAWDLTGAGNELSCPAFCDIWPRRNTWLDRIHKKRWSRMTGA